MIRWLNLSPSDLDISFMVVRSHLCAIDDPSQTRILYLLRIANARSNGTTIRHRFTITLASLRRLLES